MVSALASYLVGVDWRIRGRYSLLAVLLTSIKVNELLNLHHSLLDELVSGMEISLLVPAVTEFYGKWMDLCVVEWELDEKRGGPCLCDRWMMDWAERVSGILIHYHFNIKRISSDFNICLSAASYLGPEKRGPTTTT